MGDFELVAQRRLGDGRDGVLAGLDQVASGGLANGKAVVVELLDPPRDGVRRRLGAADSRRRAYGCEA